ASEVTAADVETVVTATVVSGLIPGVVPATAPAATEAATEHRAESRADQDATQHVTAAEAGVITPGVRGVHRARLPVRPAVAADGAGRRVGVLAGEHPLRVGRARGHRPRRPAGRCPHDVLYGRAVLRVEEAGSAPLGHRTALDPRPYGGHEVAAVLQRRGDP